MVCCSLVVRLPASGPLSSRAGLESDPAAAQQKKNNDQNQNCGSSAVIADAGSEAVSAETKHKNENDDEKDHGAALLALLVGLVVGLLRQQLAVGLVALASGSLAGREVLLVVLFARVDGLNAIAAQHLPSEEVAAVAL
jgi:hypothetical protein